MFQRTSANRLPLQGAKALGRPVAIAAIASVATLGVASTKVQSADIVKMDGSSTVFPISEAVAEEFQAQSSTKVTVGVSGTGGGFKKFCAGEIDLSGASRPIKDKEKALCEQAGIEFQELPVAIDALTVVINPNNTWAESMTVAELKKIWSPESQNTVKKWSDVKPGWPDAKLVLYAPGTDSGTFDYFTKKINGKTQASRSDFTASEDDNILVQGVLRDPNAMAYFGYSYYNANKDKLKAVAINGVKPEASSVENGTYKPLSRKIYIYVNKKAAKKKHVKSFVNFYLDNTARLSEEVGYVRLSEDLTKQARENFREGRTGKLFSSK